MKDVETLIYSRLTGDTTGTNNLQTLLGGSGRIIAGFQRAIPNAPQLIFYLISGGPGQLMGDFSRTIELFYQFSIFADNHTDISFRLLRLFDGHSFESLGAYTQIGQLSSILDVDGTVGYDDALEVGTKEMRFRFFVVPKAVAPI